MSPPSFTMGRIEFWRGFLLLLLQGFFCSNDALVVPLAAANPKESLKGVSLRRVVLGDDNNHNINRNDDDDDETAIENKKIESLSSLVDLGAELGSERTNKRTMVIFGSHAGDFNTIEYLQKVRFSLPKLQTNGGIDRIWCVVNGMPDQVELLGNLLDLPPSIQLLSDPIGEAGRCFGVDRGFRPDDESLPPFAKQFFTGIGIGPPWMTLPAVLPGYTGNPNGKRDWIEASLKQGQLQGRWPSVLELDGDNDETILGNKFDEAPLGLGNWGRRPFELATLRLQSLIGIQIKHWSELKPVDDRCLTQLGGCTVVEPDGTVMYSWVDRGLCDVPDIDDLLNAISPTGVME